MLSSTVRFLAILVSFAKDYIRYIKITGFLSNNATFKSQSLMSYISINFRPSVPTWLAVASSNHLKPVWSSLVRMTNRNSMAYYMTSILDFDKGGCVFQIEWTKAL